MTVWVCESVFSFFLENKRKTNHSDRERENTHNITDFKREITVMLNLKKWCDGREWERRSERERWDWEIKTERGSGIESYVACTLYRRRLKSLYELFCCSLSSVFLTHTHMHAECVLGSAFLYTWLVRIPRYFLVGFFVNTLCVCPCVLRM